MTKSVTVVGVHEAKTNLSRLLRLVESGAEVQIRRGDTPVARLLPVEKTPPKRRLGSLQGRIWMSDDFDEPMPELEEAMENGEILPA
ncbi:MAG: type II toxin-antitoxin system Phd/YefM family antitoxin [Microbacterium sp.]